MTAATRLEQALDAFDLNRHNAIVSVDAQGATRAAAVADQRARQAAAIGPLDGAIVAVKDNIDTAAVRTTLGSRLFADRTPDRDAAVVARLRAAGAVVAAKANLTELACGTTGRNDFTGDVENPAAPRRSPGGSSCGSAAAVASGDVDIAIGTDTACSIRLPAAACGVVGLKPTFGRIPTDGVSICSRRLDHVGPITRDVRAAAEALAAIQRDHVDDPTALLGSSVAGLRVGVLVGAFADHNTPPVAAALPRCTDALSDLGCQVSDLDLSLDLDETDRTASMLCVDLAAAYGHTIDADREAVSTEVLEWLGYYRSLDEVAVTEAVARQARLTETVAERMADVDVVVCSTTRDVPALWADVDRQPRDVRTGNCSLWNLTGQPSLSLPVHLPGELPVGLLITARRGADARVLQVAHALERTLC